jgi:hypothetical protein
VQYWREGSREVDFVLRSDRGIAAIEVKSRPARGALPGMAEFERAFRPQRKLLVGGDGMPLEEFLSRPAGDWLR